MKRIIALLLSISLLFTGCTVSQVTNSSALDEETNIVVNKEYEHTDLSPEDMVFTGLDDESLQQYLKDSIYITLDSQLNSNEIIIDNISTKFISKEYLNELDYNSKNNLLFGYDIHELDKIFEGTKYVFTLGENNSTTVVPMETLDGDEYGKAIKNVAVGSGVIVICVTASVVTGAAGYTTVSLILTASANTATAVAVSSATMNGLISGVIEAFHTGDLEQIREHTAVGAGEGFMLGAIFGAIGGAAKQAFLTRTSMQSAIPTPRESELIAFKKYGGREQISYLNGVEVPLGTPNSTRPDIIIEKANGVLEAIEVKNYDLVHNSSNLYRTLKKQVAERVIHLPEGSTQKVVLDVQNRGYSDELLEYVVRKIKETCYDVYPDLPVEILR